MRTVVAIKFDAHRVPGGADAILGPCQCEKEVVNVANYKILGRMDVTIMLDEKDERVPKVLALLAEHGEDGWVFRNDIYTEDELQAARLLVVSPWGHVRAFGGPRLGTSYDMSKACPRCGTGARQTSAMILDAESPKRIEKLRIASTYHDNLLIHDSDAERLLAANVTGLLLWTVYAKKKDGSQLETRRQQMFAEHVMPPMAPSSLLDRTGECPVCHRGGMKSVFQEPLRFAYRPQDLVDIQDVNLTWEWFGDYRDFLYDMNKVRFPDPSFLVTPKVMNLLRDPKKKKYQGVDFIPIWIEDSSA